MSTLSTPGHHGFQSVAVYCCRGIKGPQAGVLIAPEKRGFLSPFSKTQPKQQEATKGMKPGLEKHLNC